MSKIDTSTAAVERMAKLIAMHGDDQDTAALSALLAERDMWRQENLKKQIACEQMGARIVALEAARDAEANDEITTMERDAAIRERDAARAEAARLRGAGLDALATATAAHSLLSRGGKRAAPSDMMFLQMLSDYEASITRARAALAAKESVR